MHVTMLDVGWFTAPAGIWRQGDPLDEAARFPIPAYLVETATHRVLIDTGLHPAAVRDAANHYNDAQALAAFELEQGASIAEQVDLGTLTHVVLTHLHFDHAGALALIPKEVPVTVQRREWAAGHDDAEVARNFFLPRDYASHEHRLQFTDGEHDLLGDGSIVLLPTPGHTPGHQSVRVGESLIIGGDVTHYASGLDDHRFPIFADDHAAQASSAVELRRLRDAGADVRPGHDPAVLRPGHVPVC